MDLNAPLKQEVARQLPWLFQEFGFAVVEDSFEPKSFGNSFVALASPELRLRFVRDRGQVSIEVASPAEPKNWWNLEHVCELVGGSNVEPRFELEAAAALLRENLPALVDALGRRFLESKRELERRAEKRKREFLARLSGQAKEPGGKDLP